MNMSPISVFWRLGNRRLASDRVVKLAKGAVSWLSRIQAVTASGTSETG